MKSIAWDKFGGIMCRISGNLTPEPRYCSFRKRGVSDYHMTKQVSKWLAREFGKMTIYLRRDSSAGQLLLQRALDVSS